MLHFPLFCPSAEPSVANISPKLHKSFLQTWCLVCSFSPGSNCFFFPSAAQTQRRGLSQPDYS